MKHLIILTFDLEGAESSDYDNLNEALKRIGFVNSINAPHLMGKASLPSNTYSVEFDKEDIDLSNALVTFAEAIKKAFIESKVKGEFFVQITNSYKWTKGASK